MKGENFIHNLPVKRSKKPAFDRVKRHRPRKNSPCDATQQNSTLSCTVMYENTTFHVCKAGFLSMFGLKRRRLENAVMKVSIASVPQPDKRGRHEPSSKIKGLQADLVRDHIRNLPTVSSHYSRAKSPHRHYLESHLTISRLYDLYLDWMSTEHQQVTTVKKCYYHQVFTKEFNISFQPPWTDTCNQCDAFVTKIATAKLADDANLEEQMNRERMQHKNLAQEEQQLMKGFAKDNDPQVRVICVDLQQTLPSPKLSPRVAYYKRKLWMYNLCIHDIKKNISTMYCWDEVTAGRGSAEIASCIRHWIAAEYARHDFDTLIVFSDNCGGQNKNINIILCYLRALHAKSLQLGETVLFNAWTFIHGLRQGIRQH